MDVQLEPNSLDAFLYSHEITLTIDDQKDLPEEADPGDVSEIFAINQPRVTTGTLTYKGRQITRQVRDLHLEFAEDFKTPARHRDMLSLLDAHQPDIIAFLYDFLRGIRELGVLSTSKEDWLQKFGVVEKDAEATYAFLLQARSDAETLFGADYPEFAQISNYDEQFVWMVEVQE